MKNYKKVYADATVSLMTWQLIRTSRVWELISPVRPL